MGQDVFEGIGKPTSIFKLKLRRGYVRDERLVLSNTHSLYLVVTEHNRPRADFVSLQYELSRSLRNQIK